MAESEISVSIKPRWWTMPLLRAGAIWYRCGLPINIERVSEWIGEHGFVVKAD